MKCFRPDCHIKGPHAHSSLPREPKSGPMEAGFTGTQKGMTEKLSEDKKNFSKLTNQALDVEVAKRLGYNVVDLEWPCHHSPDSGEMEAVRFWDRSDPKPQLSEAWNNGKLRAVYVLENGTWPPKKINDPCPGEQMYAEVEPVKEYTEDLSTLAEVLQFWRELTNHLFELEYYGDGTTLAAFFIAEGEWVSSRSDGKHAITRATCEAFCKAMDNRR